MLKTTYTTLISNIKAILEEVTEIKSGQVYSYPVSKPSGYPAVIFYPSDFNNSFETNQENFKIYKFKIFVVIGITNTTTKQVFETVLPKVVDAIAAKFDNEWDGGVIDNHRIWYLLDSGNWGMSEEKVGAEAWAELNLTIKLITNN